MRTEQLHWPIRLRKFYRANRKPRRRGNRTTWEPNSSHSCGWRREAAWIRGVKGTGVYALWRYTLQAKTRLLTREPTDIGCEDPYETLVLSQVPPPLCGSGNQFPATL